MAKADVQMGWLDRIIDINFVGGIGVLLYNYEFIHNFFSEPGVEELDQTFAPQVVQMFKDAPFTTPLSGGKVVPVGSNISDAMLSNLQAWSVPFYHQVIHGEGTAGTFRGTFVAFYNLTGPLDLKIIIPPIPNNPVIVPGTTTWVGWLVNDLASFPAFTNDFLNNPNFRPQNWFGDLFLSQPPNSPGIDTWSFPSLAVLLSKLGNQLGVYTPESITGPSTTQPDLGQYNWEIDFWAYDSTFRSAPLDAQNNPLWDLNKGLISSVTRSNVKHQGAPQQVGLIHVDNAQKVTLTGV